MKHSRSITLLLLGLFFLAQVVGLFIVGEYVSYETVVVDGEEVVQEEWAGLPYEIERPEFAKETSYIPIMLIILVATGIIMLLVKFKAFLFWKFWFFLSVWLCLVISFGAFFSDVVALGAAFLLTLLKIFRQNLFIHNLTELFIYGGLAAILVPVLNLFGISLLLVLISVYDFIAVRGTGHMVQMAKFQTKSKLFAGLMVPYGKGKTAILGGGDIAFPLLFSAVFMQTHGLGALVTVATATLGLGYLLYISKKNTFYPAMPFITAGCFVGYLLVMYL